MEGRSLGIRYLAPMDAPDAFASSFPSREITWAQLPAARSDMHVGSLWRSHAMHIMSQTHSGL